MTEDKTHESTIEVEYFPMRDNGSVDMSYYCRHSDQFGSPYYGVDKLKLDHPKSSGYVKQTREFIKWKEQKQEG